jgi:hypothetical protein
MEIPEKRVFGALLLLLGVSFLSIAIYTGQVDKIVEMLKTAFKIVTP